MSEYYLININCCFVGTKKNSILGINENKYRKLDESIGIKGKKRNFKGVFDKWQLEVRTTRNSHYIKGIVWLSDLEEICSERKSWKENKY